MESTDFSDDYATARSRFRQAISQLGWLWEAFPLGGRGPAEEELTFDVACSPGGDPKRVLVLSSGLHGVEGFFGSAVQSALLQQWASPSPPPVKIVLLHGLNPFGFAWLRRFDGNNIDPNRNFLLPPEDYAGSPDGYRELNPFLNPHRPPSRWEPFLLKALWMVVRRGMPALQQAIAAGQYDFPQGLFYGGDGPSPLVPLLEEHLPCWLEGAQQVVHLDFHTGLGPWGTGKLLLDTPTTETQHRRLVDWFGEDAFVELGSSNAAYHPCGGFGQWCAARGLAADYLYACAEFGTYGPIKVLAGLRAENQAHHWGDPDSASTRRAKQRLKELFCPSSLEWRSRVLKGGMDLAARAIDGLASLR